MIIFSLTLDRLIRVMYKSVDKLSGVTWDTSITLNQPSSTSYITRFSSGFLKTGKKRNNMRYPAHEQRDHVMTTHTALISPRSRDHSLPDGWWYVRRRTEATRYFALQSPPLSRSLGRAWCWFTPPPPPRNKTKPNGSRTPPIKPP